MEEFINCFKNDPKEFVSKDLELAQIMMEEFKKVTEKIKNCIDTE